MDHKKKQWSRRLLWLGIALVIIALAAMPLLAASREEEEFQASILSAQVEKGSIQMSMKGGGTLTAAAAMDVTLPAGVKITEFLVSNGDTVTEGTPVAKVDRVSVMNAIVEVRSSMDQLQQQITDAREDSLSATIKATAGGRVKQIYAQSGEKVTDVMLRDGALAILSLDGRMAVQLERKTSLGAGDSVCVSFSDGQEVSGRVESNLNGTLVVTVEDEDYEIGTPVTVTLEDGTRVGSGTLYVHNAWKAVGYGGTVKSVSAKVNKTLSAGATLFTLTDTEYTGNLEAASNLHREYEALAQKLFQMYETETLTAPCDGVVSGVEEDSAFLLAGEGGWTLQLLSSSEAAVCTGLDKDGKTCKAEEHREGCYFYCTGKANCTAKQEDHKLTCLSWCISAEQTGTCKALNHKSDCIEKCEAASEVGKCPATAAHKSGCIESCIASDGTITCPATLSHKAQCLFSCDKTENCPADTHHYDTCLTHCTGDENCPAVNHKESCYMARLTYRAYAGAVRQVGTVEVILAMDITTEYQIKPGVDGWQLIQPDTLKTDLMITEQTVAVAEPAKYKPGDILLLWTGYSGDTVVKTGDALYISKETTGPESGGQTGTIPGGSSGGSMGSMGGMTGGLAGSFSGGFPQTSGQSEEAALYDLTEQVLLTVTDQSAMKLTITLDQHDIGEAYLGQEAQVKITALRDREFLGAVTDIGSEGTSSGGSSKFTLDLTVPWEAGMLSGMNATATLPLYTKMDVLTLPVAALSQKAEKTVVYTALDPDSGEPTAPVEVTTGISDGETVEILSGLDLGDQVYYSYYDVLELDQTAKTQRSFGR